MLSSSGQNKKNKGKQMSIELCKELARLFEEQLHNQKKLAVIDDIIAEEFTNSDRGKSGEILTRQSLKEQLSGMFQAVPDLHDDVHEMVAEDKLVIYRLTRSGTFTDKLGELAPTGKYASINGFHILTIDGGFITGCIYHFDTPAMYEWFGIPLKS